MLLPIAVAVATIVVGHVLLRAAKLRARRRELRGFVESARAHRRAKRHDCLEGNNVYDVDAFRSAAETRRAIAAGELDAAANVRALARRCRKHGRQEDGVNAVTEEFYDEAHEAASALGSRDDDPSRVLRGVPMSVKDCLAMKGALQTGGLACRASEAHRSAEDSLVVSVLRNSAGALPMVRGNVGQLMMLPESRNDVWGETRNPWDLSRVPGGSSGGEGALVAMGCVPLAMGSDVGGSVRIPAAFCGVVGFKPTSTRVTKKGSMSPSKDNKQGKSVVITAVVGPLARTVDDCALFMRAVCVPEMFAGDPSIPPLPFRTEEYEATGPLRFGYYQTDGWFEPCATAKRAVAETVAALTKAGHECVPFDPPGDGWNTYALLVKLNAADGNMRLFTEALEGERMIDSYNMLRLAANLPNALRAIVRKLVDKRRSYMLGCAVSGGVSVHDYWQMCADLLALRNDWADAVRAAGVDVVLHPALPLPALPHGASGDLTGAFSYTFLANLLSWPAGVVPVTTVRPDEQRYPFEELPETQRDHTARCAARVMENSAGLPMSVAVMTPGYRDETCLRAMREVERVANFRERPRAYETRA